MAKSTTAKNSTFATRVAQLQSHRLAATSKDIAATLSKNDKFGFDEDVNFTIDTWGIDTTQIFANDRNPKVIKRFIQFVKAATATTTDQYKNGDKVTSIIIYALHLTKGSPLTTDALHYLGAGLREGKVSPESKGISRATLSKLFGSVGLSTIPTQASRTVGKSGFLQLMGATMGEPGKQNQRVTLNESHPAIVAFFETMSKATAGQLDAMTATKGE